jgi:hypothetical protein
MKHSIKNQIIRFILLLEVIFMISLITNYYFGNIITTTIYTFGNGLLNISYLSLWVLFIVHSIMKKNAKSFLMFFSIQIIFLVLLFYTSNLVIPFAADIWPTPDPKYVFILKVLNDTIAIFNSVLTGIVIYKIVILIQNFLKKSSNTNK